MDENINFQVVETPLAIAVGGDSVAFDVLGDTLAFSVKAETVAFQQTLQSVAFQVGHEPLEFIVDEVIFVGVEGIPEDEMVYAKRVDFISESVLYKGEAAVGAATSVAAWRIRRITIGGDNDVTEEWADGVATFTKVWDDRASLSYS